MNSKKIDLLIVDDSKFDLEVIKAMLKGYNITTEVCLSAPQAIDIIQEKQPHVIIIDYEMPHMNGDDMIIAISERKLFATSSFILLSGRNFDDIEKMKLQTLGLELILKKPINKDSLFSIIEEKLNRPLLKIE